MNHNTSNPTAKIKKKGDIECCKNCAGGKCKTQDEVQLSNEEETFSRWIFPISTKHVFDFLPSMIILDYELRACP